MGMLTYYFAKNCMKMKEFGPRREHISLAPSLGSTNVVGVRWVAVGMVGCGCEGLRIGVNVVGVRVVGCGSGRLWV